MKISGANIKAWSRLGQRGTLFGIGLPELAAEMDNLSVLTADLAYLSGMDRFIKKYPDKFIQAGIAEQNMMCVAAGLAMEGECVVATTYASFIAVRSLEQIRQNISYPKTNVKIIGSSAGVIAAKSGVSHWATEDLAFMRALPNMTVISPADSLETLKAFDASLKINGPVYIRLSGGLDCPIVYSEDYDFKIGKINLIRSGSSIAILSTGLMVSESLKAADLLMDKGLECSVFDVHTIKPLDRENLTEIFKNYSLIVTVEEHNVIGGLGGAIAEFKATQAHSPRQIFIGFNDEFTKAGSQRYIWDLAGLTSEKIAKKIYEELGAAL